MGKHRVLRGGVRWLPHAAAGLVSLVGGTTVRAFPPVASPAVESSPAAFGEYTFHYDGILGTSMDLIVRPASAADAVSCRRAVLEEIRRLSAILSTYDSSSEISRVMNGSPIVSDELAELLALHDLWSERTGGAIHANLAEVRKLWEQAERDNINPDQSALRNAFLLPLAYNVDALGKAFIIDKAVAVARRIAPAGLLDLGGDIRAWGDADWTIGVKNPFDPADNASPAAFFTIRESAVATSGGYARYFTLNDKRLSHIIDPRMLAPVPDVDRNATIVARDCVTSNALSTAGCVLDADAGDVLADRYAMGRLSVHEGGIRTGGVLSAVAAAAPVVPPASIPFAADGAAAKWAKDFRVEISVILKMPDDGKVKRPYVAVWIEDDAGKPIRNVALWGTQDKYLPDLSTWFKLINRNLRGAHAIATATRPAGKYLLIWDGRNDAGKMMPQGTYTVRIEINREHGQHAEQSASIKCQADLDSAVADATPESDASNIEFKKAGKK